MTNTQLHDDVMHDLRASRFKYHVGEIVRFIDNSLDVRILAAFMDCMTSKPSYVVQLVDYPSSAQENVFEEWLRPVPHSKQAMRFILRVV